LNVTAERLIVRALRGNKQLIHNLAVITYLKGASVGTFSTNSACINSCMYLYAWYVPESIFVILFGYIPYYTHANRQGVDISVTACNVGLFVRLRISPLRIKLVASNFVWQFTSAQGRESLILGHFAPPEAQNWMNRPLCPRHGCPALLCVLGSHDAGGQACARATHRIGMHTAIPKTDVLVYIICLLPPFTVQLLCLSAMRRLV